MQIWSSFWALYISLKKKEAVVQFISITLLDLLQHHKPSEVDGELLNELL